MFIVRGTVCETSYAKEMYIKCEEKCAAQGIVRGLLTTFYVTLRENRGKLRIASTGSGKDEYFWEFFLTPKGFPI